MRRRWAVGAPDPRAWERLSRALGVSALVARVLAARGFDADGPEAIARARAFLAPRLADLPDPLGIPGMSQGAARIARAVLGAEPLWIYTDYDADGVTSAALLAEFLEACGVRPRVRLPRRDREGYGLKPEAVREMAAEGARVVVTADCGIRAVEAARVARGLGVDLVITDHHEPGDALPEAAAVVNPRLSGSSYPERNLAGVGVAWNLAAAVRRELREGGWFGPQRPEPDLRGLLDLVALGTVADVVPLTGVNRTLVAHGLAHINRSPRPGLAALGQVAGVRGPVRSGALGFRLGPRINAAGRLSGPAEALELLRVRESGAAHRLAARLDRLNRERQAQEARALGRAVEQVEAAGWWPERWSLVAAPEDEAWHEGVVGLVASRLVERYHRPSVVLTRVDGGWKGSARSVPGLHLVEALSECADLLDRFGGHRAAAGLTLGDPSPEAVERFRERFEQAVRKRLAPEDLVPVSEADAEVPFAALSVGAVRALEVLEPHGPGNPRPRFVTRGVRVGEVRPLGQAGEHLRVRLEQGGSPVDAVVWRPACGLRQVFDSARVDVLYTVEVDTWGGAERVRLVVEDAREARG